MIRVASAVETDALPYDEAIDSVVIVGLSLQTNDVSEVFLLTSNAVSWFLSHFNHVSAVFLLTSNAVSWLSVQYKYVSAVLLLTSNAVSWLLLQ